MAQDTRAPAHLSRPRESFEGVGALLLGLPRRGVQLTHVELVAVPREVPVAVDHLHVGG